MARKRAVKRTARVEYEPPSTDAIRRLARAICEQLAQHIDPVFRTPEAMRDMQALLTVAGAVWVRRLNARESNAAPSP